MLVFGCDELNVLQIGGFSGFLIFHSQAKAEAHLKITQWRQNANYLLIMRKIALKVLNTGPEVTHKEVQIVYRLLLVNCYLLHVPRVPSQPSKGQIISE